MRRHKWRIVLGFRLERTLANDQGGEDSDSSGTVAAAKYMPQLALSSSSVQLEKLELVFDGSWFSWVYNVLSFVLQDVIASYLEDILSKAIEFHCGSLLAQVNLAAVDHWPLLLQFTGTDLDILPVAAAGTGPRLGMLSKEVDKVELDWEKSVGTGRPGQGVPVIRCYIARAMRSLH